MRLTDHQVWSLEELDENGPGTGPELMEERRHGAATLDSFIGHGFITTVGRGRLGLTDKGREALASVPEGRRGKERPVSWRQKRKRE